jgi:hypothetical protein
VGRLVLASPRRTSTIWTTIFLSRLVIRLLTPVKRRAD